MSETTKIQWADATWNPWEGCTKVSPGCANCYAEARNHRFGHDNWGRGKPRRRTSPENWKKPRAWNREDPSLRSSISGHLHVFPSLCDWLDPEVPIEWLADFLRLIHDTANLDWLNLTKRPELFLNRFNLASARLMLGIDQDKIAGQWVLDWMRGSPPSNVRIGVSVEDQQRADERIPELLKIPAQVRFLSCEPLLGPVSIWGADCPAWSRAGAGIDWVIIGGESGPRARPCNVEWIRNIVQQCKAAGAPCFVKQLGSHAVSNIRDARGHYCGYQGLSMKDRKGGDPSEWPVDLRVRQMP